MDASFEVGNSELHVPGDMAGGHDLLVIPAGLIGGGIPLAATDDTLIVAIEIAATESKVSKSRK